jgi:hypothetical protein
MIFSWGASMRIAMVLFTESNSVDTTLGKQLLTAEHSQSVFLNFELQPDHAQHRIL